MARVGIVGPSVAAEQRPAFRIKAGISGIQNVNVVANETGPTEAAKLVDTIMRQARELAREADREGDMER